MKKELQFKGLFDGKNFKPTHVELPEDVVKYSENEHLGLEAGWHEVGESNISEPSSDDCPPDPAGSYYVKIGGQCVLVKNS